MDISVVGPTIFRLLREMDQEANSQSYYQGVLYPTGLREYAAHLNPNNDATRNRRYVWEDALTRALANRFQQLGVEATTFPLYATGKKADLALRLMDGKTSCWIEVKNAWRYNLHPTICDNRPYRKHLYLDRQECAALDFLKLRDAPAAFVGVLLIGFDIDPQICTGFEITDLDLREMKNLGNAHDWHEHFDSWPDQNIASLSNGGARVRCWFWWRERSDK